MDLLEADIQEAELGQSSTHLEHMRPHRRLRNVGFSLADTREDKLQGAQCRVTLRYKLLEADGGQLLLSDFLGVDLGEM